MSNQPAVIGPDGVARPYIGGQALIEGVMMRSPHAFAAVVRRRDGTLLVRQEPMRDLRRGPLAVPLVRGIIALVEALKLGSRAIRFSADAFEADLALDEQAPPKPPLLSVLLLPVLGALMSEPELPTSTPANPDKKSSSMTWASVAMALALFVALPQAVAQGATSIFKLGGDIRSPVFQLITGGAKITIFIGMLLLMRRLPEIYRMFQYHGAEHKSIYAYEGGRELALGSARPQTTLHPRCGTTFIVMVALVSIVAFTAIGPLLPNLGLGRLADNVLFFFLKLPFLPLIAAVTFELQRLLARFATSGPLRVLLWPGFLVQKITTIEPDDAELEVALAALAVAEKRERATATEPGGDRAFSDFSAVVAG